MPKITLDNFSAATNEQIYAYLVDRLGKKPAESRIYGHLLLDPEVNERVIASKLELCRAYCEDPERIAWEYEKYREAGFDPEAYGQLAFIINNLDVLDVLHRHTLDFAQPNIPQVLQIYEQELREKFRDRMLDAVIEALILDIPQDQKDLSDIIVMRNAIRELDQHLAHFVDLLKSLDMNDAAIGKFLGMGKGARAAAQEGDPDTINNPYTLRMMLERRYVIAAMAKDQKFMKFLRAQYEAQNGLLTRVNQTISTPAIPSSAIDGLELTAHLHNFNSKLYNKELKTHLNPADVEKHIAELTAERIEFMTQARRTAAKKAPAKGYVISDTRVRVDEDFEKISEYLNSTVEATQQLLDTAGQGLSGQFRSFQARLNVIKEELNAIKEDAADIYNEEDKYAAGYKFINLIWNLSHLLSDVKQYIQDNALAAVKGVAVALNKATGFMEPLTKAASKLVPDSVKKVALGPGLKTTQRREQRQNPSRKA